MTPLDFLNKRKSVSARLLTSPAPSPEQITQMIELACRVPDHGRLAPFRFIQIAESTKAKLGEKLALLKQQQQGKIESAHIEKERQRFASPCVIAVIACLTAHHKIPEQEQLLTAGLAAYNLLLGAEALGFAAQWLTGWPAYDITVEKIFQLNNQERIIGFIHIGTAPLTTMTERKCIKHEDKYSILTL